MNFEMLSFPEQERIFKGMKMHWNALRNYQPKPYFGSICFFETEGHDRSLVSTWEELGCNRLKSHMIAATHLGIMASPYVEKVAKLVDEYLEHQKEL